MHLNAKIKKIESCKKKLTLGITLLKIALNYVYHPP